MMRYALDHGINYFDSAYRYHNGESERVVGRFLAQGNRHRVHMATKLPPGEVKTAADFDRLLHDQLAKLQTDYLDVYLIHGLRQERWEFVRDLGIREWLTDIKAKGLVRAVGFSFHDSLDAFKSIIDSFDGWDVCQVQYNYMNTDYQAGTEGVRYAASKGMAVVVMEPLLGGRLVDPPDDIAALWQSGPTKRSPAEWGLEWVWNQPEVSVVLSGMSTPEQMRQNVESAGRSGAGLLDASELALVEQVRATYEARTAVPCTSCAYCMPCPNGVDIPRTFSAINSGTVYNKMGDARGRYTRLMPGQDPKILASSCIECRTCEEKCPQHIQIADWMPVLHEVLTGQREFSPSLVTPR
jgi:predicted aldo/keto reductase-like oxidoreductase